jgi:hypothetical protein
MAYKQTNPLIPLSDQDTEALEDIFEKVAVEDIKQIEQTVALYAVTPLDAWEEQGWVVNSSLPDPNDIPLRSSMFN